MALLAGCGKLKLLGSARYQQDLAILARGPFHSSFLSLYGSHCPGCHCLRELSVLPFYVPRRLHGG